MEDIIEKVKANHAVLTEIKTEAEALAAERNKGADLKLRAIVAKIAGAIHENSSQVIDEIAALELGGEQQAFTDAE